MHRFNRYYASEQADTEATESTESTIKVFHNNIYYYGPVDRDSVCDLCKEIKTLECKLIQMKHDYSLTKFPKIFLHIQSEGGDAFSGLSAMDKIASCKVPVVTIVEGYAASAASFMLLGGSERRMTKHSHVLIHEIKTEFWGKFTELKDEMVNCDKLMDMIKKMYKEKTSIPNKTISTLLKKDLYLNAEECLSYGIVDMIE